MNTNTHIRIRQALDAICRRLEPMTPAAQVYVLRSLAERLEAEARGEINPTEAEDDAWMRGLWKHADVLDTTQA